MVPNNFEDVIVQEWEKDYKERDSLRAGGRPAPQATEEELGTMFCNIDADAALRERDTPCKSTTTLENWIDSRLSMPPENDATEIERLERLLDVKQIEILVLRRENNFYKELLDGNKE
jgi:hypothetical protein